MKYDDIIAKKIITSLPFVEESPNKPIEFSLIPYQGTERADKKINHFVIFLKPESLNYFTNIDQKNLLGLVFSTLEKLHVRIGGVRLLSGCYLRQNEIISNNYKLLNNISINGLEGCSKTILEQALKIAKKNDAHILGGHQFLNQNDQFNSYSLCALSHNLETIKLGSGAYAANAHMFGQHFLLLNAFHPYQIDNLTRPGTGILALECFSKLSMNDLRFKVIGNIFPEKAEIGSIRRKIFDLKEDLRLPQVNIQYNYVHISPGPLEGIFQLIHFFSDYIGHDTVKFDSTNMGLILHRELGLTSEQVMALENNPEYCVFGQNNPILDSVENLSTQETLDYISTIKDQIYNT